MYQADSTSQVTSQMSNTRNSIHTWRPSVHRYVKCVRNGSEEVMPNCLTCDVQFLEGTGEICIQVNGVNGQWMSDKTMSVRIVDGENVEDMGAVRPTGVLAHARMQQVQIAMAIPMTNQSPKKEGKKNLIHSC